MPSQLLASAADALVRDAWPAAADMPGSITGALQEAVEDASKLLDASQSTSCCLAPCH